MKGPLAWCVAAYSMNDESARRELITRVLRQLRQEQDAVLDTVFDREESVQFVFSCFAVGGAVKDLEEFHDVGDISFDKVT